MSSSNGHTEYTDATQLEGAELEATELEGAESGDIVSAFSPKQSAAKHSSELLDLQEAIGHLAKQLSDDYLSNQEQFRRIEKKLELWIRTNQSLMEGQQETAKSNHRLVEAIIENTSEMQRTTQEQQRSATSFEKGTDLLKKFETRLKALEKQTNGFSTATTELNGILTSWKPLLEKTQTLGEIMVQVIPQMNQFGLNPQNPFSAQSSRSSRPSPAQELDDSLRAPSQNDPNHPSQNQNNQNQSSGTSQTLNSFEIKRWIGITRRDLLWTGRGNLAWSVISTLVLIALISSAMVNGGSQFSGLSAKTNSALKMLQRVENRIR